MPARTTNLSRRTALASAAGLVAFRKLGAFAAATPFKIGITDWNLYLDADPAAVPAAARLGFKGVQISCGRKLVDGKMPMDNPQVIAKYRELARQANITIDGTCVDRLHDNGLKSDPLAPKWVSDAIRLTKAVGTKVLLVPFFGKWAMKTQAEMDYVGDAVRELGPEAEKAGVILGLEDTISAQDNARILERARSKNVLVYYDVGNSTVAGFDPVKEIRWLGKERICQVHLKDNPHLLGQGTINFDGVVNALKDIGYVDWANLETDAPRQKPDEVLETNLKYIRNVMAQIYG
jgi:L-ribulose-5-phosphate 3-epimerase